MYRRSIQNASGPYHKENNKENHPYRTPNTPEKQNYPVVSQAPLLTTPKTDSYWTPHWTKVWSPMLFPLLPANKGDLLYFTKNSHYRNSLSKGEDVFGFFFTPDALPSCPLLACIFLNMEIISFSKPTVGILTKLLKLISLLKRPSKGCTSLVEQLPTFTLGESNSPKLTMSLQKGPSSFKETSTRSHPWVAF